MARIRTVKPEFFTSEDVSALPLRARLTWIGLWTHCDDHGRTKDNVKLIKAAVWPLDDVSIRDVEIDLNTLADRGLIERYEVDGRNYLAVTKWDQHQSAAYRRGPARYPPSPDRASRTIEDASGTADLSGTSERASRTPNRAGTGNREQGTGGARGAPPPLRCPGHEHNPNPPPCGGCGDARRSHDAWQRAEAAQPTPVASMPDCTRHPGLPAVGCPACAQSATPAPTGWRERSPA